MKATVLTAKENQKGDRFVPCPNAARHSRRKDGTVNMETVCQRCPYLRELGPYSVKCLYDQVDGLPDELKEKFMQQPTQDMVMV